MPLFGEFGAWFPNLNVEADHIPQDHVVGQTGGILFWEIQILIGGGPILIGREKSRLHTESTGYARIIRTTRIIFPIVDVGRVRKQTAAGAGARAKVGWDTDRDRAMSTTLMLRMEVGAKA